MEARAPVQMQWAGSAGSGDYTVPAPPPPGPPPSTAGVAPSVTTQAGVGQGVSRPKKRRKTQLCPLFAVGTCKLDSFCPDAHGQAELVPNEDPPPQPPPVVTPPAVETPAPAQAPGARPAFIIEEPAHIQAATRPALIIQEPQPVQAAIVPAAASVPSAPPAAVASTPATSALAVIAPEPIAAEERPEDMIPWDEKLEAAGATGIAPSWEALFATQEDNPPPEPSAVPAAPGIPTMPGVPAPAPGLAEMALPGAASMVPPAVPVQPIVPPPPVALPQQVVQGVPAPPPFPVASAAASAVNTTPSGRAILTPSGKRPLLTPSPGVASGTGNALGNLAALIQQQQQKQ